VPRDCPYGRAEGPGRAFLAGAVRAGVWVWTSLSPVWYTGRMRSGAIGRRRWAGRFALERGVIVCAYVLVAEDDLTHAELVRRYLRREGHSVHVVHDGRSAIDETRCRRPDLLIVDVMMPNVDGLDVCRVLRQEMSVPVLMLTARSTRDDLLLGFDLGADDYLTKPYDPRELMARVRALLRRVQRTAEPADLPLRVGDLTVDPVRHAVTVRGERVECTAAEFRILATLAAEPQRVFTRGQLVERAYGVDAFITERTIDVHVMNLRKKIEVAPRSPDYLLTVHGVGYKLTDGSDRDRATRS
jgi:two-component system, OmpR family, alkaline phosphatase synthesis response regulator PhoP